MSNKRITFKLSEKEYSVLSDIAKKQDLSHSKVMRQSLAMYQMVAEGHSELKRADGLSKAQRFGEDCEYLPDVPPKLEG